MDVTPTEWFCENCGAREQGITGKMPEQWRWVCISPALGGGYHEGGVTCPTCVKAVCVALVKRTEATGYVSK